MPNAPEQPKSIPIRPLTKGMNTSLPSQLLDLGSGLLIQGLDVTENGLRTTPEWVPMCPETAHNFAEISRAVGESIMDALVYFTPSGTKQLLAVGTKFLYVSTDAQHWTRIAYGPEIATSSYAGGTLTLSGVGAKLQTNRVRVGMSIEFLRADKVVLGTSSITEIVSETELKCSAPPALTASIKIYSEFAPLAGQIVQWAKTPDGVFFVDGTALGLRVYAGAYLLEVLCHNEENPTQPLFIGAQTIDFVENRLLLGGLIETQGTQRMRWSSPSNHGLFDTLAYQDLVNSSGRFVRITHYDDYPVVFLEDAVYFGQPYGYNIPDAPAWIFRMLETGGMSMVGPRAFARLPQGLVYVARDDFKVINPLKRTEKGDFSVENMNCPILKETIRALSVIPNLRSTVAQVDSTNGRLLFAFAEGSSGGLSLLAILNLKSRGWSLDKISIGSLSCLADLAPSTGKTWAQVDGFMWSDFANVTYYEMLVPYGMTNLFAISEAGIPYITLSDIGSATVVSGAALVQIPHTAVFVTGDMDFGDPDSMKAIYKMALRLGGVYAGARPDDELHFYVDGSVDRGRNWKRLGRIVIGSDEDEDEIHFRISGTNIRLRITISFNSPPSRKATPIEIEELTLRARVAGRQMVRNAGAQEN